MPNLKKMAIRDYEKLNNNHSSNFVYEVNKKLSTNEEYKTHFKDEIDNFRIKNNINVPSENYVNSKLDNIFKESNNLPEEYQKKFEEDFNKKYPSGLNPSINEINDDPKKDSLDEIYNFEKFKESALVFINTEKHNDNIIQDNTKYMMSYMNKNPHEFTAFSERFFNEGIRQNSLPEKFKNFNSSDVPGLSKTLSNNVISKAKEIVKISSDADKTNELSKSLTNYRKEQFRGLYEDVKKSNALKQALSNKQSMKSSLKI